MLLCALHGLFEEGKSVEIIDSHGFKRTGKVVKSVFELYKFDMSLIQIDDGQKRLPTYVPIHRQAVESPQNIQVIGLIAALNGDSIVATLPVQIFAIEPDSSLFRTTYYDVHSFSGVGVIVIFANNRYELVGVNVAANNPMELPPVINEHKANDGTTTADSNGDAVVIPSTGLQGRMTYCLVAEPIRTKEILDLLPESLIDSFWKVLIYFSPY